jgi:hypothetical protein
MGDIPSLFKNEAELRELWSNPMTRKTLLENAMEERVNGILKDEFYLDQTFKNVAQAKKTSKSAINLYDEVRLLYL